MQSKPEAEERRGETAKRRCFYSGARGGRIRGQNTIRVYFYEGIDITVLPYKGNGS